LIAVDFDAQVYEKVIDAMPSCCGCSHDQRLQRAGTYRRSLRVPDTLANSFPDEHGNKHGDSDMDTDRYPYLHADTNAVEYPYAIDDGYDYANSHDYTDTFKDTNCHCDSRSAWSG
jgi:hypothetical protein